ncbi:MAG: metallophosphoesterase [Victivallaceae bacterium]|nr:metallophosphoesterase [Victivallaceae bacterium]
MRKDIGRRLAAISGIIAILSGIAMLAAGAYLCCRFGNTASIIPPASKHLAAQKKDFRIAFFGDFAMQTDVIVPVLKQISADRIDFAISVGDMFRTIRGAEGAYLVELLQENLSVPMCAIPGNHDILGKGNLKTYCHFFGNPYYFFSFGDTLFIMLNDNVPIKATPETLQLLLPEVQRKNPKHVSGMDDEELAWLESVLSRYRQDFRRCVLVMHRPPVAPPAVYRHIQTTIVAHQLKPLLKRFPIDAIVSGHLHTSGQSDFEGVPVYHVPCSGQKMRDTLHPDFGYLTLHFTGSGKIEAIPSFLPGLKRGRNYFLNYLVVEIPGNCRYYYCAWLFLAVGLGLLTAARKRS